MFPGQNDQAAPPAVGSAAISAPMKGPERSTTMEATTTMLAVITILSGRPAEIAPATLRHRAAARRRAENINRLQPTEMASVSVSASGEPRRSAVRMSTTTAKAKPPSPITALAITAAVAGPPTRRCKMIMMLVSTMGTPPDCRWPCADVVTERDHRADQQRHHRRAQHQIVPARPHARHRRMAQRRRQPEATPINDDVEQPRPASVQAIEPLPSSAQAR